jgi:hypothetical protein
MAKNFTLQDATVTLAKQQQWNAMYFNMSSSYAIDDAVVNSVVIKESRTEDMNMTVMLTQCADSM